MRHTHGRYDTCMYCHEVIRHEAGRGWVHVDGGGAYRMYCPDCGWSGAPYPSPGRCPQCRSIRLRDHHAARPDYGEQ